MFFLYTHVWRINVYEGIHLRNDNFLSLSFSHFINSDIYICICKSLRFPYLISRKSLPRPSCRRRRHHSSRGICSYTSSNRITARSWTDSVAVFHQQRRWPLLYKCQVKFEILWPMVLCAIFAICIHNQYKSKKEIVWPVSFFALEFYSHHFVYMVLHKLIIEKAFHIHI